jgi:hypothetical protein
MCLSSLYYLLYYYVRHPRLCILTCVCRKVLACVVCGRLKSAFQIASRSGSVADVQYVAHQVNLTLNFHFANSTVIVTFSCFVVLLILRLSLGPAYTTFKMHLMGTFTMPLLKLERSF